MGNLTVGRKKGSSKNHLIKRIHSTSIGNGKKITLRSRKRYDLKILAEYLSDIYHR